MAQAEGPNFAAEARRVCVLCCGCAWLAAVQFFTLKREKRSPGARVTPPNQLQSPVSTVQCSGGAPHERRVHAQAQPAQHAHESSPLRNGPHAVRYGPGRVGGAAGWLWAPGAAFFAGRQPRARAKEGAPPVRRAGRSRLGA